MAPSLDQTITLIAIAPFLAAILAPFIFRFAGSYSGWILAIVPAAIFLYVLNFIEPVAANGAVRAGLDWIPSYDLRFSFLLDGLSLTFALTIAGVGTLILIYSGGYLKGHPHQGRFLAYMLAFMGAMLGLVTADNLVSLVLFWELTSVTSFLLIGFDHMRQAARRAAIQALVVTGAGGLALLLGAVILHQVAGNWELSAILGQGEVVRASSAYLPIFLLLVLAAFTKSAQVPFHFWLPNAMEAPTPVSAFLHSATMVQAGVYLLLRTSPILGGTAIWEGVLVVFGAATLIWGSLGALRQTDLKQMLAQTTIASLGLLVLLIGLGSELAINAAIVYFVAHALYKAALFLVVGVIDHETGTRDITLLRGLRGKMPLTFAAAVLAGLSMVGLPLTVGYLAKEEMYAALAGGDFTQIVVLIVLIAGNGLLAGVGLAVAIKPFFGTHVPTPTAPHEGGPSLLAGPVVLSVLGIAAGIKAATVGMFLMAPAATAVLGHYVESHLKLVVDPTSLLLWLSVATWAVGVATFLYLDAIRSLLRRGYNAVGWTFDKGFDSAMFGLIRFAATTTRFFHHGRLELYIVVLFVMMVLAVALPLVLLGGLPAMPAFPALTFYEWGIFIVAITGLITLLLAPSRLVAIVSLGVQGLAVAMLFLLFGAPDLAFTQFMVEILSVVILALVMTRLKLDLRDRREFEDFVRDGTISVAAGAAVMVLLLVVVSGPLDTRLSDFFTQTSVAIAHGHNIVNVILVDYRGLDTLGEISVVMTAGIAVLALLRRRKRGEGARQATAKTKERVQA
ncbi:Na(+)/H(+) antiporter subunit A [Youhaiella tibetensis]|uniref:putative monovalent cation/H+ antiporter subunit A n=1 Tax=Paradevosia tibetensis TaxID=1447062 RepID=UPI0019ABD442|nr:putative monovalent cation/H+ antiporter subunit A [Youhaiella tibetensis]GGF29635.1 Na(+)/H(+) antiporter subunit A [Youhaiella tibetensis]